MMSQDSLSLALSTGLGFSVLAGLVSGVVYILSIGCRKRKRTQLENSNKLWHCNYCGAQFRSICGVLESEEVVKCVRCNGTYCKQKCSSEIVTDIQIATCWICKRCRPDSWMSGVMNLLQIRERNEWFAKKVAFKNVSMSEEANEPQRKERDRIREFIEHLVESLLGSGLDNTSVHKLYNDDRYLPIAGESPCSAHASLKKSIQRFVREASELQDLRNFDSKRPNESDNDFPHRTYEDVLSTAIINTVVENYQSKPSAPAASTPNPSSCNYEQSGQEYFLGEPNLDTLGYHQDDGSSISSLDEYINTNGTTKYFDQMNDAIRESYEENEEDVLDDNVLDSTPQHCNDWQKNWMLCKKDSASGANSPLPVPMLVPNPTSNAKVLIGDREAEDTTDLSDAASDYEDSLESCSLNAVLVNSKTIIGGKNPLDSLIVETNSTQDAESVNTILGQDMKAQNASLDLNSDETNGDDDIIIETLNSGLISMDLDDGACADIEDYSFISLESNTEKDSEYTEQYATLPRKVPMVRVCKDNARHGYSPNNEFTNDFLDDAKADNGDSGVTSDEDDRKHSQRFQGTSYAEREKDKWNHAVNIPNNPYSKSNLEHRLSNRSSNSSINSFATDYLISAARPKGTVAKNWNSRGNNDEVIADNGDEDSKLAAVTSNHDAHQTNYVDPTIPQDKILRARPGFTEHTVTMDKTTPINEIDTDNSSPKRIQSWDISSDSDFSIERTYNINSGKIIKKHGDIEYEVPPKEMHFESPCVTVFDENQNTIQGRSTNKEDIDEPKDLSISPVVPPAVNHFKLVNDIANESSDQYHIVPISPPAEYKTICPNQESDNLTTIEDDRNLTHASSNEDNLQLNMDEKSFNEISLNEVDHVNHIQDNQRNHHVGVGNDPLRLMSTKGPEQFITLVPSIDVAERELKGLKEQHIVSNLLTAFSKSHSVSNECLKEYIPNRMKQVKLNTSDIVANEIEIDESLSVLPTQSINDTKKAYNNETDKKDVYSLTARSLPKHVRQELAAEVKSRTKNNEQGELNLELQNEPKIVFPNAKNRIAYWEQMSKQQL